MAMPKSCRPHWLIAAVALLLSSGLLSCGPKPLPPASPLDTPARQYGQGLARLAAGDLWAAQAAFERVRALDPDHPGSYVGAALVAMEQGEFWSARQDLEKALHKERSFVDAHTALGRVATAQGRQLGLDDGAWLEEALQAFDGALRLDPDNDGAAYHRALSLYWAGEFAEARASLVPITARNRGALVADALALTERIQLIERASPGTPRGVDIARSERLTRAEMAVLLMEELKLGHLVRQRRPAAAAASYAQPDTAGAATGTGVSDIDASWARPWIEEMLSLGVPGLELMPDGSFHPEEAVTRAAYARVNAGILEVITGQADMATRYVGQPSPFPDVGAESYAFSAIALNVDRGIMQADTITGSFRPGDPVSGAEALIIVRELQNAVRMEF